VNKKWVVTKKNNGVNRKGNKNKKKAPGGNGGKVEKMGFFVLGGGNGHQRQPTNQASMKNQGSPLQTRNFMCSSGLIGVQRGEKKMWK